MYVRRKIVLLCLTIAIFSMVHSLYLAYSGAVYGSSPDWVSLSAYRNTSSNDIYFGNTKHTPPSGSFPLKELNRVALANHYRILVKIKSYDWYMNSYSLAYLGDIKNYLEEDVIDSHKPNGVYVMENSDFLQNEGLVRKLDDLFGLTRVQTLPMSSLNNNYSLLLPLSAIEMTDMNSTELWIPVEDYADLMNIIGSIYDEVSINSSGRNMSAFLTKLGDSSQKTFPAQVVILLLGSSYVLYLLGSYKLDLPKRKIQYFFGQTPLAYLTENIQKSFVLSLIGLVLSFVLVYAFMPILFTLLSWQYIGILSLVWIVLTVLSHILGYVVYKNDQG